MDKQNLIRAVAIGLVLAIAPAGAESGQGIVTGRVVDRFNGKVLPGATVLVQGSRQADLTDREGRFRLLGTPVGPRTLEVSYLGYQKVTVSVDVGSDVTSVPDIVLGLDVSKGESVAVVAEPILEGQAKALNQQKTALNIKNVVAAEQIETFPDYNAAESVQRIPGVYIERDQGEGRYVLVRGTESRLNSVMIDGQRVASPDDSERSVTLDSVPSSLLKSIEVTKALTPDMDGDAIGGVINLVTKTAPLTPKLAFDIGGGYNSITEGKIAQASGWYGRRFAGDALGLSLGGSYMSTDRGSDDFEPSYDAGTLAGLQVREYTINRKRYGGALNTDFKASDRDAFILRGNLNKFQDQEYRRYLNEAVSKSRMERDLKDRYETQTIGVLSFEGDHLPTSDLQLTYKLGWNDSQKTTPNKAETTIRQSKVNYAPNVTPSSIDPDNIQANPLNEDITKYTLNNINFSNQFAKENDLYGQVDLAFALKPAADFGGQIKLGIKARAKDKRNEYELDVYTPTTTIPFTTIIDQGYTARKFLDGRYVIGQMADPTVLRGFVAGDPRFKVARDYTKDASNYDAGEDVYAGYGMAELFLGSSMAFVGGLRYEYTKNDYTGTQILLNPDGSLKAEVPIPGNKSYGDLLPMVHARFRLDEQTNLRAAVTRTLARPNYTDLAPSEFVDSGALTISRGNTNLDATTSWNFDLMGERYLSSVGVLSAGVFHKRLSSYIVPTTYTEVRDGVTYRVTQPVNGESATLTGFEVAFQNQFRSLPGILSGLGFYVNYTYADSSATFPGRTETSPLPGQAKHVGNVALSYERGGFAGRVGLNYSGHYINGVGVNATKDTYVDNHVQLDFAATQRIFDFLRFYVNVLNLTNEPLRVYEGVSDRPIQEEHYKWWGTLGVKVEF